MPLVACPKCSVQLRVPDGSTAAVRCPKCHTAFQPPPSEAPAFEVVDEPGSPGGGGAPFDFSAPAKPARPGKAPPPAPARPPVRAKAEEPMDLDADDRPKKRGRRDDDDDDDDRPRSRSRSRSRDDDYDDDDDRPRKRSRRDDDYDDDDDRPRSRSRGRSRDDDYDDDDDYDRPRKRGRRDDDYDDEDDYDRPRVKGLKAAKVGLLMLAISLLLYVATFAVLGLFMMIGWGGGYITTGAMILPGLLGLANWIVGGVGLGFAIAGPARTRVLAIITASIALVHLIFGFIVANNIGSGIFGSYDIQIVGITSKFRKMDKYEDEKSPNEARQKQMKEDAKSLEEFRKDNKDDLEQARIGALRLMAREVNKNREKKEEVDSVKERESKKKEAFKEMEKKASMRWGDLGTLLKFPSIVIQVLAFDSFFFSEYILGFIGGALELARLVLLILLIGALARTVRARGPAGKAKIGVITLSIAFAASVLLSLLSAVIIDSAFGDMKKAREGVADAFKGGGGGDVEKKMKDARAKERSADRTVTSWIALEGLFTYALYGGALLLPTLAAFGAFSAVSREARYS